jgi:hypothetical protein
VLVRQLKQKQPAQTRDERKESPQEVAALPTPQVKQAPRDPEVLTRALQTELKRVGCDPGEIDGIWGDQAREALGNFARSAKLALSMEEPTSAALEAVTSRKERVCPLDCDEGERKVDGRCIAAKPGSEPRRARSPSRERRAAQPRRRQGPEAAPQKGMCWAQDGRNFAVVPCN